MKLLKSIATITLVGALNSQCGSDSNINGVFFSDPKEKETQGELLSRAEHHYDLKEYSKAEEYTRKALSFNPNYEEAIVLHGYIKLAQAGIEIFRMVDKLIEMNDETKSASTSAQLASAAETATDTLNKLQDALFVNSESLGTDLSTATITVDGKEINGDAYKLRFPVLSTEARTKSPLVMTLNDAMNTICPFVNATAKSIAPQRYSCTPYTGEIRHNAKIYFLWALTHLAEAAAFNAPLSQAIPPLQTQIEALTKETPTAANIGEYVTKVANLTRIVAYILPSSEDASLLSAVLNNLRTTNVAFGQIKGIPEDVTSTIDNALSSISTTTDKIKTGTTTAGDIASQTSITKLKDQMTSEMASKLNDKIDTLAGEGKLTDPAQKAQLCAAIKDLSSTSLPTACKI
jgi:tetratricopeptide (TPR) repeat protein